MTPRPWTGFVRGVLHGIARRMKIRVAVGEVAASGEGGDALEPAAPWQRAAARRRRALLALVILTATGAAALLATAPPIFDHPFLRLTQILLCAVLFAWVSAGFFTALMGFIVQWRGDPHALSAAGYGTVAASRPIDADARTAIIMPICNEQVSTVFAGLRAICESLARTGQDRLFDVYVLSDTADPALGEAERVAWAELRLVMGDSARIHYRWRQRRTRRKAGNVADFCRRWGRNYRYMVVLDADSVMSGECLVALVRMMEAHPRAGILQTAPQAFGLDTLHARAQQFAGRVTGRLFTAGMQYWQLGESHYWGHNAIIRVEPFMRHCALAKLPGKGGLSGEILSHDFIEAALMRRGGHEIWLVGDLPGSYEQQPPNLLAELQRDRRWCQGNLQNARLIAEPGLARVYRFMLASGAMSYLSAPLWLCSILLAAGGWLLADQGTDYKNAVPGALTGLWLVTLVMLLLPRGLGLISLLLRQEQRLYGGTGALLKGTLLEAGLSILQAPVRMTAHSLFVFAALTGLALDWRSPPREAEAIRWRDALARFGPVAAVVLVLALAAFRIDPAAVLLLAPGGLPLLLTIPLTVLTSRAGLGARLRSHGLLVTPEESWTPRVLRSVHAHAD